MAQTFSPEKDEEAAMSASVPATFLQVVDEDDDEVYYASVIGEDKAASGARRKRDRRKLSIAIVLCLMFFGVELAGGLISGSLAILSDSFHLLSDVISFIISLAAIIISGWRSSDKYAFGYHRAETIGAFLSILMIYGLTVMLVWEAVERVRNPEPINGLVMFIVALIGVVVNIVLGLTLHEFHDHGSHSHDTSVAPISDIGDAGVEGRVSLSSIPESISDPHHKTRDGYMKVPCGSSVFLAASPDGSPSKTVGDRHCHDHHNHHNNHDDHGHHHGHHHGHDHQNLNIRAALIHILGDLISSIGVLVAAVFIMVEDYRHQDEPDHQNRFLIVDPICTFLFSVLVLLTTVPLMRDCLAVLMETAPRGMSIPDMKVQICQSVPLVRQVADIKCWNLAMNMPAAIVRVTAAHSQHASQVPELGIESSPPHNPYTESFASPAMAATIGPAINEHNGSEKPELSERDRPLTMTVLESGNSHGAGSGEQSLVDADFRDRHEAITRQIKVLMWRKYRVLPDRCFVTIDYPRKTS